MLWKVLVPLCLLCLSGFASGDEDFEYLGKRKLMSVDTNDKTEKEDAVTENNQVEDKTENQTQGEESTTKSNEEEDKSKLDKESSKRSEGGEKDEEVKPDTPNLDKESSKRSMFNSTILPWHKKNTFLHLYTRNQNVQIVPANRWFENFVPNRDLVILVHGPWSDSHYINAYFNTLSYALLNESNYNVIGVDWKYHVVPETKPGHLESNIHFAKILGIMLHALFTRHLPGFFTNKLNTYYIGHDLGTIPPVTFEERFKKPFQYVYGLNPRRDLPRSNLRLAQEHGEVVAILNTNNYPYSYGHKNIIPVSRGEPLPPVYQILAKIIIHGRRTGTFCSSAEYFQLGYCNMLPHVPIWFTHAHTTDRSYPIGHYYFYETSSIIPKCASKRY